MKKKVNLLKIPQMNETSPGGHDLFGEGFPTPPLCLGAQKSLPRLGLGTSLPQPLPLRLALKSSRLVV